MSKPETEPEFLTFDVQLWRRDIQTFADTTRLALEAIVGELSNQCSGGTPRTIRSSRKPEASVRQAKTATPPVTTKPNRDPKPVSKGDGDGSEKGRLTDLKAKLAERLARK